jgi:uncharacterized protein (TIGR01777 family)
MTTEQSADTSLRVAVSGASGFVGSRLGHEFRSRGWHVVPLPRSAYHNQDELAECLHGADAVVNLAGAPILARWTESYKKLLYESRVNTTRSIVRALEVLEQCPRVLVSASAIGIYDTGGTHTEAAHVVSSGFLGRLAADWEREALAARDLGIRTVVFRFGVVLGRGGGALEKMLPPFRAGLGGVIGDGTQPFSWVHLEDLVAAHLAAIEGESYQGIYNLTAPSPVTNRELTEALGRALSRPAVFRIPAFVLRMQFGEGAKVLSEGQRVLPERLLAQGFGFLFPTLEEALRDLVG